MSLGNNQIDLGVSRQDDPVRRKAVQRWLK